MNQFKLTYDFSVCRLDSTIDVVLDGSIYVEILKSVDFSSIVVKHKLSFFYVVIIDIDKRTCKYDKVGFVFFNNADNLLEHRVVERVWERVRTCKHIHRKHPVFHLSVLVLCFDDGQRVNALHIKVLLVSSSFGHNDLAFEEQYRVNDIVEV